MTKSEKEKAKKAQAKLEALKAAGMIPQVLHTGGITTGTSSSANKKHKPQKVFSCI